MRYYGFEAKCASVRAINVNVEECVTERERTLRELSAEIRKVVAEDRADVVILACAGLCGTTRHSKIRKFAPPPQSLDQYL